MQLSNTKTIKSSYQINYSTVKSNKSGTKNRKRTKENELKNKVMQCIATAFVYLKWVSAM